MFAPDITINIILMFASVTAIKIKKSEAPTAYKPANATCPGIPQTVAVVSITIQKLKPASLAIIENPIIVLPRAKPGTFEAS